MKGLYVVLIIGLIFWLINNQKSEHYGGGVSADLMSFINWFSVTPGAITKLKNLINATNANVAGEVTFNNNVIISGVDKAIELRDPSGKRSGFQLGGGGRLHIYGDELLFVLNKDGMIVGTEWGGNGSLLVSGPLTTQNSTVTGNASVAGNFSVGSNLTVGGKTTANDSITINGIDKQLKFKSAADKQCGLEAGAGGRLHVFGDELLYILPKDGTILGPAWGSNGNLLVQGTTTLSGPTTVKGATVSYSNKNFYGGDLYQVDGGTSATDCKDKCSASTHTYRNLLDTATYQKSNNKCWCKSKILSRDFRDDGDTDTVAWTDI